ncbi:MAG: hypothetical protein HYY63_05730 [Elusimicrobia bacterium]|nr:hypothetical protein [Elusimicrobiota bacterium]
MQKLFRKELNTDVETELAGKTLYVSFTVENLVSKNFELPKEVLQKLEDAMLSITRISLSTDAEIEFTVIEARDPKWGVQTNIIRKMHDLKGLLYWKVSKSDFDERLVLETEKIIESKPRDWHDITLPEFMGRCVASRISLGTRANPFLNVLLGIEKMTSLYDPANKTLTLAVEGSSTLQFASTSSVSMELLRSSICEQMNQIEKKYPAVQTEGSVRDPDWARRVIVKDMNGEKSLEVLKKEWRTDLKSTRKKRRKE